MLRTTIAFVFGIMAFSAHAEVAFVPTEKILLSSDLIVIAKVRSANEQYFKTEIIDIYKGKPYGLSSGQYVKVQNFNRRGCNSPFDISSYDTLLLALTKISNSWRVTNRQYIQKVKNNRCQLVMQCEQTNYLLPECKKEVISLCNGFRFNEQQSIEPQVSLEEWESTSRPKWTSYLMFRSYGELNSAKRSGFICGSSIAEPEPLKLPSNKTNSEIHELCEVSPKPMNATRQQLDSISGLLLDSFPEMRNLHVPNIRFILSFVSEVDSTISVFDIPRSGYPKANAYLTVLADSVLRFEPGSVSGHEKNRCKTHYPMVVRF